MGVAHVGLVHCDPCKCKVKGFRAVSSIERNVSNRRHLQGVRHSSGFGRVGGGVTKLAVGAGMVLGPAPGVPACSGCSPVGLRRLYSSLSVFFIFWL